MQLGLLTAFVGGVLALLSPCSALLLPAFFASTVGARARLLVHGAVFYLGLLITLVPIGLGVGALGSLMGEHRGLVIGVTSFVLVALGLAQILGFGFDLAAVVPGARRLQGAAAGRTGFVRTLLLGAAGGVAGFCAGPILGAILTLGLARGSSAWAGLMLAVYGAGMVMPLMALAAGWQRLGVRGQSVLRGRSFVLAGRRLHSTSVITGVVIALVGVLFWFTNGLVSLPQLVPADVQTWLQNRSGVLASPLADLAAIVALAGIALGLWARSRRARDAEPD